MRAANRLCNPRRTLVVMSVMLAAWVAGSGCSSYPRAVPPMQQRPVGREVIDTPAGTVIIPVIEGLTCPTCICIDNTEGEHKGTVIVAEGGLGGEDVRIFGLKPDNTLVKIYPQGRSIPLLYRGFEMFGPVGGMTVVNGRIIVSHRDSSGRGVITSLGYDGSHSTIVADLPAQGDYGVTDVAISPINGRLYFGVGAATNSAVVGLDNWQIGWVGEHPQFHDTSYVALKLLGFRFDTKNPRAGLFGGADIAVTAPFQAFNSSNQTRIAAAENGKPTAAIYSVSVSGGDLKVEAHGIRLPRGLAFNEFGNLFFTNDGMELRGTRPVKDDPDALLRLSPGALGAAPFYGWPDYTTDFHSVGEPQYQPPLKLVIPFGYPEVSALIDHHASGLDTPDSFRSQLLFGVFKSQSGAAKLDFVPGTGPFKSIRAEAIIALSGDHAPFATSGEKLSAPVGYKIVRVDVDPAKRQVREFIHNTSDLPASRMNDDAVGALERPCDVKFAPDGSLYVLDMGRIAYENGKEKVAEGTGRLYHLVPQEWATSQPTTRTAPRSSPHLGTR